MFNPSREQVRQFFVEAWQKHRSGQLLTPLETMAVDLAALHPEYHAALENPDYITADYTVEKGQSNPFLHLSMHLAINEQLSINQPPGIAETYKSLLSTHDAHDAAHIIMDALGEVIWEAQRLGTPFDSNRYLELIKRYSTR